MSQIFNDFLSFSLSFRFMKQRTKFSEWITAISKTVSSREQFDLSFVLTENLQFAHKKRVNRDLLRLFTRLRRRKMILLKDFFCSLRARLFIKSFEH